MSDETTNQPTSATPSTSAQATDIQNAIEKPVFDKQFNASLGTAIRESQILLAYASQNGAQIDESVIKVIVSSGSFYAQKTLGDEDETAFWVAFNTLAKAVAPVSVNSLRSILDPHEMETREVFGVKFKKISLARGAVRWYTTLAIITLCMLLTIQIYWLFGTQITADIQKITEKHADARAKWEAAKLQTQKLMNASGSVNSDVGVGVASSGNAVQDASNLTLKALEESYALHKKSSYEALFFWSRIWAVFLPIPQMEVDNPAERKIYDNSILLQSTYLLLDALQRYILPLLYGLLGTCVYVLRTLTAEITERTYSEASNVGFRIRLYLGTLGGMVFAWFIVPENSTDAGLFKSLSPFALAFLAGYSVEILFAAMDRFLVAFTSKPS